MNENNIANSMDYLGPSFHELSEEEMKSIVGASEDMEVSPQGVSAFFGSFVISWLGSAAFNCK
ncbi:lichenicidin A2 family type 2 lantibiotic [Marinilactibacillus sp. Marseille-P9653]|uniref:lichenicidin A2 family type 2 lantibiotic n=1 Tax=Marinilactibacillus sp. Marseille-P9653 TaxID=2866583 RepID=UPI001CE42C7C|nr:lichenicidin A2 family type 2 lantibiotic [Marinilactibacillus sp. Marseille-P9653]